MRPKDYTKSSLIAYALHLLIYPLHGQNVDSLRINFDQSKQLMVIQYDLHRLNFRKEIFIEPSVVIDTIKSKNAKTFTGDIGWINRNGRDKTIYWDAFKDGITDFGDLKVEIVKPRIRNANLPNLWVLSWHGSNSAPLGLKLTKLGSVGLYGSLRAGHLPQSYRYTVSNEGAINFTESGVYEIGSKQYLASFAITGGPLFQLGHSIYAYAGAGYGLEQLFWEYQEYNLDRLLIGNSWALNENFNSKGTVIDLGFILRKGKFTADFGLSSINFSSFQILMGLGWTFYSY